VSHVSGHNNPMIRPSGAKPPTRKMFKLRFPGNNQSYIRTDQQRRSGLHYLLEVNNEIRARVGVGKDQDIKTSGCLTGDRGAIAADFLAQHSSTDAVLVSHHVINDRSYQGGSFYILMSNIPFVIC
jgi:hypothetical protein